jgi:hypothetical protein
MPDEPEPFHVLPPPESEWMDVPQAAEWLGLKTEHELRNFRRAIREGEIPAIRISAKVIRLHKPTIRKRYSLLP